MSKRTYSLWIPHERLRIIDGFFSISSLSPFMTKGGISVSPQLEMDFPPLDLGYQIRVKSPIPVEPIQKADEK